MGGPGKSPPNPFALCRETILISLRVFEVSVEDPRPIGKLCVDLGVRLSTGLGLIAEVDPGVDTVLHFPLVIAKHEGHEVTEGDRRFFALWQEFSDDSEVPLDEFPSTIIVVVDFGSEGILSLHVSETLDMGLSPLLTRC